MSLFTSRGSWRALVVAAACAAAPAFLAAQETAATDSTARADAPPAATASLAQAIAPSGARTATVAPDAPTEHAPGTAVALQQDDGPSVGKNFALVVVGAAGVVTGALVGGGAGTAIIIGGAAVGLYGLYQMLR